MRVFVALLVLSSAAASAQDAGAAREIFAAAERAFDEHDHELALELFRRAQALEPHDAVRFNVAVCLENLGRFREAALEYELAAASEQLSEEARALAREHLARTRARLGTIEIRGRPAGARVSVGALGCDLPCSIALDPGEHTIEIAGARVLEERRTIARGETIVLEIDARAPAASPVHAGWGAFGVLSGVGAVTALAGLAGIVGFGVATEDLAAQYSRMPTMARYSEGLTLRDWANASIGVAALGLVLVAVDLVLLATE